MIVDPQPQLFKQDIFISDLEEKLEDAQKCRMRLIVTDGVFSMDGNVTPLKDIHALADKYNALIFIDDCHATGFFGKTGRLIFRFVTYISFLC